MITVPAGVHVCWRAASPTCGAASSLASWRRSVEAGPVLGPSFASGAGEGIARHNASFRSESWQPRYFLCLQINVVLGATVLHRSYACRHGVGFERGDWHFPRCRRHELSCWQYTLADQPMNGLHADAETLCRLVYADCRCRLSLRIEWCDAETLSQLADAHGRPCFAVLSLTPHSVHGNGKLAVRPMTAELADHVDGVRFAILRITATTHASDTQLGVPPADPMDRQHGLVGGIVEGSTAS